MVLPTRIMSRLSASNDVALSAERVCKSIKKTNVNITGISAVLTFKVMLEKVDDRILCFLLQAGEPVCL